MATVCGTGQQSQPIGDIHKNIDTELAFRECKGYANVVGLRDGYDSRQHWIYQAVKDREIFSRIRYCSLVAAHYAAPYATCSIFETPSADDDDNEDIPQGADKSRYDHFCEEIRKDGRYHSTKVDMTIRLVKSILDVPPNNRGKIAIFSRYIILNDILKIALEEELTAYDIESGSLDGRAFDRRSEIINDFQNPDSKLQILLCTASAAGEGIDLTAASCVILFQPDWNPAMEGQIIARAHRIGNGNHVWVFRMAMKDSLDVRVKHKQGVKLEKAEHFDGTYDYTVFEPIWSVNDFMEYFNETTEGSEENVDQGATQQ